MYFAPAFLAPLTSRPLSVRSSWGYFFPVIAFGCNASFLNYFTHSLSYVKEALDFAKRQKKI